MSGRFYPRSWVEAQAEDLAEDYAESHGLPIDPAIIAKEKFHATVIEIEMPDDVDAMLIGSSVDPVIAVSQENAAVRQRFSIAHEIGHIVHHGAEYGDKEVEYNFIEYRDLASRDGNDPVEVFANQYGAALLMPRTLVNAYARQEGLVELARRFGVSVLAMQNRLANLQVAPLIDEEVSPQSQAN